MRTRTGTARLKKIRPEPCPARIRPSPVDNSTAYVYVYIVYEYVVLTRVCAITRMHRDVIIYAWETGKRSNTTATLAYYKTFIVAILLDMT